MLTKPLISIMKSGPDGKPAFRLPAITWRRMVWPEEIVPRRR